MNGSPVFDRFRRDHVRVLGQLDALERAIDGGVPLRADALAELDALVRLLRVQFATHVAAEERALYPALAEALPETAPGLEPLEAEHSEMRSMLARLQGLLSLPASRGRDEQVVVQSRDLVDLLRIHVRKEEHAVFDVAARVLTAPELARLAERCTREALTTEPEYESGDDAGKGLTT